MAINPYLPQTYLEEAKRFNELALSVPPREESGPGFLQKFSHSHLTMDEILYKVTREDIGKDTLKMRDLLKQMNPEHFKCESFMMDLVKIDAIAYAYVHPSIKTPEFTQEAIVNNPAVFDQLTHEQQRNQDMISTYRCGMNSNKTVKTFDDGTEALQYEFRFSDHADKAIFFNADHYKRSFEHMFQHGAHVFNDSERCYVDRLNDSFAYLSAARALCPEMADTFDRIECEVMISSKDIIVAQIRNSFSDDQMTQQMAQELVDAVIARCEDQELMQKFPDLKRSMGEISELIKGELLERANEIDTQEIEGAEVSREIE